ncbi:hypothetical protein [Pseudoalteromonas maricaloris]|uniref:hypothetical protein n=1 Tax=Pseudoalteromonas maricaloris TaxID=184924 RepID=UPI00029A08CD|nr:hypothetical protein [Pseudoalteromonas flavipulchra]
MLKVINPKLVIGFSLLFIISMSYSIEAKERSDVHIKIIEVKGNVKVKKRGDSEFYALKKGAVLFGGLTVVVYQDGYLKWVGREYENFFSDVIAYPTKPLEIELPRKHTLEKSLKRTGARTHAAVYRGDKNDSNAHCTYPKTIRLPKTKYKLHFLLLTCGSHLKYSDVRYDVYKEDEVIVSGGFFDGLSSNALEKGEYTLSFYEKDKKLTQSQLVVDSFDLDSNIKSALVSKRIEGVSPDMIATIQLCSLDYKYLCKMNLEYRSIGNDRLESTYVDEMLESDLQSVLFDMASY